MGAWRKVLGREQKKANSSKKHRNRTRREQRIEEKEQPLDPYGRGSLSERILKKERIDEKEIKEVPDAKGREADKGRIGGEEKRS